MISVGSWELLGTNLSVKLDGKDNRYTTDTERLAVMDHFEFEQLGNNRCKFLLNA